MLTSGRHLAGRAVAYSVLCYTAAAAVLPAPTIQAYPEKLVVVALAALPALFAAWLCETTTAVALALPLQPTCARTRYHFWRGLTHYTSGHLIVTGACGAIMVWGPEPLVPLAASVVWWSVVLARMVGRRSAPGARRVLAWCLIPLIGAGAVLFRPGVYQVLNLLEQLQTGHELIR